MKKSILNIKPRRTGPVLFLPPELAAYISSKTINIQSTFTIVGAVWGLYWDCCSGGPK